MYKFGEWVQTFSLYQAPTTKDLMFVPLKILSREYEVDGVKTVFGKIIVESLSNLVLVKAIYARN